MKKLLPVVLTLLFTGKQIQDYLESMADAETRNLFEKFMQDHHKSYLSKSEIEYRYDIFKQNLKIINESNDKRDNGEGKKPIIKKPKIKIKNENFPEEKSLEEYQSINFLKKIEEINAKNKLLNEEEDFEEFTNIKFPYKRVEVRINYNLFHPISAVHKIVKPKDPALKPRRYTLGVNLFTDLTFDEFKTKYLWTIKIDKTNSEPVDEVLEIHSDVVDWRNSEGALGPIRNQGECGSCWAFCSTASLEFVEWKTNNSREALSVQELIDCSNDYGNFGCHGGLMSNAFDYVRDNKIGLQSSYTYTGKAQSCNLDAVSEGKRISTEGYSFLDPVNVEGLILAAEKQIVSTAIEVQGNLQFYTGGIYHNDDCGDDLNHSINIVGYNLSVDDPYFIIRNTWSANWGLNGYAHFSISSESGTCGIANDMTVFPNI